MASSFNDAGATAPASPTGRARPLPVVLLSLVPRLVLRAPRTGLVLGALVLLVLLGPILAEESLLRVGWGLILVRHGMDATDSTLGLSMVLGVIASRGLVRMPRRRRAQTSEASDDLARAIALLPRQENASAGLVRIGDKRMLFSDCGQGFIMYARQGRSLVALFDPVGPKHLWAPLVEKFIAEARRSRSRPVFYQVSADFLPLTVDMRLQALKLGEQAVVDLSTFTLAGGDWLKLRRSINRAERDGLAFELVAADAVSPILDELQAVSDTWLAAHKAAEKGFSLGTFDRNYVASGPVAVIRLEGKIVAFATLMTASSHGDAFIDLMRHVPGVHRGMMDLLFVKIMETLKADGFRTLNLGMAPLAGLSANRRAPTWNHVAGQIYEHGERFYNFRGVRAFKEKFDPDWQPRYLAVAGRGLPILSLIDVTLLIGGGLKGLIRR
ncbi:bifunctional lysylphosphatidylglycerol flippase/synthetase MprF [Rhizobium sp. AQ_MP]|uniref:phosphatidylglycerol lysyltransferase domain-containing protein n=1 Tax=Rhizobium sp. AQ_MP TaxID=2761536 RepID=UPI00163A4C6F|nr:phosphatidylglycerol lysyltransferase domain-containing protein [Rhizobium sp. AQ_MP]MBC2775311.1 bifunctional lysylphosphatidylglycerol flippase/synthetase MprF [Rhizobium sp. AQ_MP]